MPNTIQEIKKRCFDLRTEGQRTYLYAIIASLMDRMDALEEHRSDMHPTAPVQHSIEFKFSVA